MVDDEKRPGDEPEQEQEIALTWAKEAERRNQEMDESGDEGIPAEEVFQHLRSRTSMKILVEQHPDGYVAYPLGIKGVVVGQGDTYEEALADVESAVLFHVETFGEEALNPPNQFRRIWIIRKAPAIACSRE